MPQRSRVVIPIVVLMILCMLYARPLGIIPPRSSNTDYFARPLDEGSGKDTALTNIEAQNGVLDPVDIWHTGTSQGFTQYQSGRTDVEANPSTEVWLPAGAPETYYSADCYDSGFFLVGPGGSADFSSPAGTLSWWGKWDDVAPHGRFWGQDGDFEIRWSNGHILLDWGVSSALTGSKSDWQPNHWYFFAITWNETSDFLGFYWGDETTMPQLDASRITWTYSVVGLHIQNDIMNSMTRTAYVDGHIDEFRYFTIERSLDDIRGDYRSRLSGMESGLSHYYMFENDLSDSAGMVDLVSSGGYAFSPDVFSIPNGWAAEQLEINVLNLRKLYGLNGSFASGFVGVNEDWYGDGFYYPSGWLAQRETPSLYGRQRASYDTAEYVVLENEGYYISASNAYRHYNDTRIFWYQNVSNNQLSEEFIFNMDYFYSNGPIGENFAGIFMLRFEVRDGSTLLWNWSVDLVTMTQRQMWNNTGPFLVDLDSAPSSFQLRLVLEILTSGAYVDIPEADVDLDGDSTNGMNIGVRIDDVSFIGADMPSCESVALSVGTPETGGLDVIGASGSGQAFLDFDSWNMSSIPIVFSANSSVSFDYSAEASQMKRVHASSSSSGLQDEGVAFSVESGQSVNLSLFTYVASYPEAEDLGLIVYHPNSWKNVTLIDPFGDEEGPIVSESDHSEVPAGVIDSVGWWIVRMQAPNYAEEIVTQKYLPSQLAWIDETVFRTGDYIRCQVLIGAASDNPSRVMSLESEIYLPSGEFWAEAYMSNATGYILYSEIFTFGSYNATAGEWMTTAFWENGSAVAFGHIPFEVFHGLTMFAHSPSIERNLGENFTAAVYIHDQQTGEPILNGDATVAGNLSGGPVSFSPNLAKGWWEADFNTSQIGVGIWVLAINASIPYYDIANCTIDIQVMTLTVMTTLGNYFVEISPGGTYDAKFRYMFLDGTGIENADVFVATWSGPVGGIEYAETYEVPGEPGNYTIEFTGNLGGTYFITVTGLKEDHATAATSFYLIVGAISTNLDVSGEELPDELYYNQTYTCTLFYYDWVSTGIEGASINITYNPVADVEWADIGSGYYQFSIRVPSLGSFSLYVRFQQFGYAYADTSFSFDVVEVPTSVSDYGVAEIYYESRTYDIALYYNSTLENGIQGATLTPSVSIRAFYRFLESGNGWYNFSLTLVSGNYSATLWLTKPGCQEQEFSFIFSVVRIPVIFSSAYPLNMTYSERTGRNLTIIISPIEVDTGLALTGAAVEYVIEDANGNDIGRSGSFVEESGVYTADITVPSPAGLYVLRITFYKDSYQSIQRDIVLNSVADSGMVLANYLGAALLGALTLLGMLSITMVARRYYHSMRTRRNLELLSLKGRLDDAKNLIGLLVILRRVGLPVYSRILKGGFEESLLSSFIAAISQFRAEFTWDAPIWAAIPITEVITAVQTDALICAIITLEGSSVRQKGQLEAFGRDVGGLYDHEDDTLGAVFHTPEISEAFAKTFDPIFESYFDGALLVRYVGVKRNLPDHLKSISEAMASLTIDYGVTPEAIIKALVMLGFGELEAHRLTLEAIDGEYLIASERELPPPESDEVL